MGLTSNTLYYSKVVIVDKQGNQSQSAQVATTTDGVHNSDIAPDLSQSFRVECNAAITLPAGGSGSQILKYQNTVWQSGSGSYSLTTGLFTAGSVVGGKFFFEGCAELNNGIALANTGTIRLALQHNGGTIFMGANAGVVNDANSVTNGSICAVISGSLNLAASDTVALFLLWQGLTGKQIAASSNCFFQGQVLPG